ncbi:alkene reductase [Acidovorax sp. FJL06]|uniref:alkene reductase n=1 Tax=Acidovorax sp. FJL06 TaxID=2153365 RepID=UPI000F5604F0|nr:alkene reductase [Acidovorax sp. FJL06]RQO83288.1 alkene reductase [Acidovorax sp. FJL06]
MAADLFSPVALGGVTLANRMVMAPMTRNRAAPDGVPSSLMAIHYGQRGDAGLVIAESAPVSAQGVGYPGTPGIYTDAQAEGWRQVTAAVHAKGGRIFAQLQHCGRISHPSLQADGGPAVAPSAIRPEGMAVTYTGMQPFTTPRELSAHEVPGVVAQFQAASRVAQAAGFDGVEIHGANGYLIDQFLRDGTNQRTDAYGGTPARRMAFLSEVLDAVGEVWATERIGVRLSPENRFNDMSDSDPAAHFGFYAKALSARRLAYLHVLEGDMTAAPHSLDYGLLRRQFGGTYIANNGYDKARAMAAIRGGAADLIAFGKPFIANPDLVTRFRHDLPLSDPDPTTFYGGDERGYTDYPAAATPTAMD